MVKRHKSGRRQILQLEDKKPPPVTVATTSKVKSLTHYSDSDDDSKSNPSLPDVSVPSAPESTTVAPAAAPMDSKVADFLKEIDALSVATDAIEDPPSAKSKETPSSDNMVNQSEKVKGGKGSEQPSDSVNGAPKQDASEVYCLWQPCLDESSGYSYFWNVQTNEVTWECPAEYTAYLEYLNSTKVTTSTLQEKKTSKKSSRAKKKAATKKEQKPSPYLKEGAIIPISYFGDSSASSDEESSSDSSSVKKSTASSSVAQPTVKSKSQLKSKVSKKAEKMGPQLPPDFQFPVEVPVSPSQSNKVLKPSMDQEPSVIGPQLPPGFVHDKVTSVESAENNSGDKVRNSTADEPEADKSKPDSEVAVDSSEPNNDWEESLLDMEKQFKLLTKNSAASEENAANISEVPDSTTKKELISTKKELISTKKELTSTKKELTSTKQNVVVSTVSGKSVVEYDSFTDSEEETDMVCSSSSVLDPPKNDNDSPSLSRPHSPSKEDNGSPSLSDSHFPSKNDKVSPLENDNISPSENDNISPSENDNVSLSKNDNVSLSKNDNVSSSKNDNVSSSKNDNVSSLNNDNVSSSKNDNVSSLNNDNVSSLKNDNVSSLKNDNVSSLKNDNVSSLKNDNVSSLKNNNVSPLKNDNFSPSKNDNGSSSLSDSHSQSKKDNDSSSTNIDNKQGLLLDSEGPKFSTVIVEVTKANVKDDGRSIESMVADFTEVDNSFKEKPVEQQDHVPVKKPYSEIVNNLFNFAKESSGKFGLGFSRSQQLQLENDMPRPSKRKRNKNYPKISFVKSKKILDFSELKEDKDYQVVTKLSEEPSPADGKTAIESAVSEITVKSDDTAEALPSTSMTSDAESKDMVKEPVLTSDITASQEVKVENVAMENGDMVKEPVVTSDIAANVDVKVEKVAKEKGDVKKTRVKKKSSKKENKDQKLQESKDPAPTVEAKDEVDDIDLLLGNILKEMVESGEAKAAPAAESNVKTARETKKRSNDESTVSTVKKKKKKEDTKKTPVKDADATASIINLSTELMEKITFLVTNHTAMASLSSVLVQVQTRLMDWQAGGLNVKYFMDRLQDVQQYLQQCELSIMPSDWTCQWDSENKQYFYVNEQTRLSQWVFPTEPAPQEAIMDKSLWNNGSAEMTLSSSSALQTTGMQFPLVSSSMPEEQALKNNGCISSSYPTRNPNRDIRRLLREPSPPPPPPGVDTPPPAEPPPPMTPPPDSPPPPPPDSTELEEGELPDVDMDLEDSNSDDSISFAAGFADTSHGISSRKLFLECSSTGSPERRAPLFPLSTVSSTSRGESSTMSQLPQSFIGQNFSTTTVSSMQTTWTSSSSSMLSCSSSGVESLTTSNETAAMPLCVASTSRAAEDLNRVSPVHVVSSPTSSSSTSVIKSAPSSSNGSIPSVSKKEKEKKKSKLHTGLSFKKRNIPSLVQKWKKIKEEQDKEDKDSDDQKISTSMK